jgi:hypothetical protein
LKRPIFKRKKEFANLSLGLIYHSKALPQPPSRDTIPLIKNCFIYAANLAAFLTAEMLERPIESAEDLSRQTEA